MAEHLCYSVERLPMRLPSVFYLRKQPGSNTGLLFFFLCFYIFRGDRFSFLPILIIRPARYQFEYLGFICRDRGYAPIGDHYGKPLIY